MSQQIHFCDSHSCQINYFLDICGPSSINEGHDSGFVPIFGQVPPFMCVYTLLLETYLGKLWFFVAFLIVLSQLFLFLSVMSPCTVHGEIKGFDAVFF